MMVKTDGSFAAIDIVCFYHVTITPEPESKWPHYTRALIMLALDSRHHHQEIVSCLERLQEVDPLRRRYYQDQRSKLIIEHLLEAAAPDFQTIDLSPYKLSKIYHRQYLNICAEVRW